ncbi:MAG: FxLYD domain-containing protein [Acidobacteriota bacterium]
MIGSLCRRGATALLAVGLLLSWSAVAATADEASSEPEVVITLDGQRIEVDGAIEEKGTRIVFRDRQGRLTSLPRDAVDFEAMRRADAPPPTTVEVPASAEPVLVLTDKDVTRFERAKPEPKPATPRRSETTTSSDLKGSETRTTSGAGEGDADDASPAAVEVLNYDAQFSDEVDEESVEIWGALQNTGTLPVDAIVIEVRLVSADGTLLANQKVTASANVLGVGDKANFSAYFDGEIFYDDIEFIVSFNELSPGRAPTPGS